MDETTLFHPKNRNLKNIILVIWMFYKLGIPFDFVKSIEIQHFKNLIILAAGGSNVLTLIKPDGNSQKLVKDPDNPKSLAHK